MIGGFGMAELVVLLIIVLMVFGVGKLPEIGGGLGKAISSFKRNIKEDDKKNSVITPVKGRSEI